MKRLPILLAASVAAALPAAPALAQDTAAASGSGGERVMMVNIRPGEACPTASDPDTIVVCDEIEDPYRIPSNLRQGRSPENRSWAQRVRDNEDVGNFGPGSCTTIGAGSEIGCTAQEIEAAYAEREQAPERRYSQQIEQARAERLETIDADARMTQARVEAIEREYMERLAAERDAALPGEGEPLPAPQVVDPAAIPQRAAPPPQ